MALVLITLLGALIDITAVLATVGFIASLAVLSWAATAIGLAISMRMKNSIKAIAAAMFLMLSIGLFYSLFAMTFSAISGAGDEGMALFVFPPLAPFLLAFPLIISTESSTPEFVYAAYFIGLGFYAALGFFVTVSNKQWFDKATGRSAERPEPPATPVHQPLASQANSC
jgi:hypothetical protein